MCFITHINCGGSVHICLFALINEFANYLYIHDLKGQHTFRFNILIGSSIQDVQVAAFFLHFSLSPGIYFIYLIGIPGGACRTQLSLQKLTFTISVTAIDFSEGLLCLICIIMV